MTRTTFFRAAFTLAFIYSWYLFFNPNLDSGIDIPHIDKVGHFIIFGGLSFLFDFAFGLAKWIALLCALLYGSSVELIQGSLPNRQASIADLIADVAGCFVYYYFAQETAQKLVNNTLSKLQGKVENQTKGQE